MKRWQIIGIVAIVALTGLGLGLGAGMWSTVCRDCPSVATIYSWEPKSSTKILAQNGELIAEFFQERRTPIEISTLPKYVPQAFVAVEDKRFYNHSGLDYKRIFGAAARNMLRGRVTGGGSTITQQLARNMFPDEIGFRKRLARKLKEARVALEIERVYSKKQILEAYINQIAYGPGWNGIETAAQHYFGKPAAQLNPAEAAMMAAVVKQWRWFSPFIDPERALQRRNVVLNVMAAQGYLTKTDAERWKHEPLPTEQKGGYTSRFAPYFVESIRITLDERYGADLYKRGFIVYTTLDVGMQRSAQEALDSGFARIERAPGFRHPRYADVRSGKQKVAGRETPYLQGVFVVVDPITGAIRALIGGRDYKDSKFNRATQALRQPGSVFKPFVFATAIASGIPLTHVLVDEPFSMEQVDGTVWTPSNYDPGYAGPVTMRDILKKSLNIPTIKLGLEVGLEPIIQQARRMGVTTPIAPYPATTIGASEMIPLQVAEAYSTFATNGVRAKPFAILRVLDDGGRVVYETRPERVVALDSTSNALTRSLMQSVVDNGTGYPARDPGEGNLPYDIPVGGKTGTTNESTDIWFAGYTPNLLAVVWFGFDKPQKIVPGAAGGVYAAPVWGKFMRSVYYGAKPLLPKPAPWAVPTSVVARKVDVQSGKLAGPACPGTQLRTELFAAGSEPTEMCDLHGPGLLGQPVR
ncbi:MAG TPA: PBP1A family penicillin-binding protein [Longimicrobiales bacterium]|nr:PBP1A family penicillin-binding protein [Longimicrobiales bacterium]